MGDVSEFVWGVIASTAGTTALLGGAAFLFRTQISHWLSKDLEEQKAQHQRDLESYKVSLIADTERSKAIQALKTAGAMKIIEKKFDAIDRVHRSLNDYVADPLALATEGTGDGELRIEELKKINAAQAEFRAALKNAEIFLDEADLAVLGEIGLQVSQLFLKIAATTDPLPQEDLDQYQSLYPLSHEANAIIKRHVDEMLTMD
jgi:hypothetical protein